MNNTIRNTTVEEDFDIPETGAIFTFGKSRFAENAPSKFWIKNDVICDVDCGDEHTAIITGSGRVFTIGNNGQGQLGLQNKKSVSRPSCVKGEFLQSSALKPEKIIRIVCGRAHTLAASEQCNIYTWGHNGDGQLGTGDKDDKYSPVQIMKLSGIPMQLAAGSSHSMLLTDLGKVYIWGSNTEGQLGIDSEGELLPFQMSLGNKIIAISCGYYHSLALTEAGDVLVWGENEHGQLGLPLALRKYHHHPQPLAVGERVTMITAGSSHSIILTEAGHILTCGLGTNGQLGQGGKCTSQHTLKSVEGVDDQRFIYISSGDNHSAAISDNGLVYTWGCGRHGKLCQGEQNFSTQFSPILVSRLRHLISVKVSCGGCHTMVLGYRRLEKEGPPLSLPTAWETTSNIPNSISHQNLRRRSSLSLFSQPTLTATISTEEKEERTSHESVSHISEPLKNSPTFVSGEESMANNSNNFIVDELSLTSRNKASIFAHFFATFRKRTPRGGSKDGRNVAFEKTNNIYPPLRDSELALRSPTNRKEFEDMPPAAAHHLTNQLATYAPQNVCSDITPEQEGIVPQLEDLEGEVEKKEEAAVGGMSSNETEPKNEDEPSSIADVGSQLKSRTCSLL